MSGRHPSHGQRTQNAIAWVLVVLLGPLFTMGALLTMLSASLGPVAVLVGALVGMISCVAAAARLSGPDDPPGPPDRRSTDRGRDARSRQRRRDREREREEALVDEEDDW